MSHEHFDYLDGWRGLAISFLLIGHFFPVQGINLGAIGVNLFFVLSGLFMSRLLFIKRVPLALFYKRRISRVVPATFVFLIAVYSLSISFGKEVSLRETVFAALFINNYFPGEPGKAVMPFGHIWSLSVEEHSYILLGLLSLLVRRRMLSAGFLTATVSAAFAVATTYYFMQPGLSPFIWLRTEVAGYGIFISACVAMFFSNRKLPEMPWFVYPTLIGIGIVLHWWSIPAPIRHIFGVASFALAVNLLGIAPHVIKAALSLSILKRLGLWSFSIYLWQQPLYLLVHRDGMNPWLALSIALLLGIGSFYLLERPAREYLNRRWASQANIKIT